MRRIVWTRRWCAALLMLAVCAAFAAPADDAWVTHAGLAPAAEAASKDGSLVLVVFGAEWCPSCRKMNEVLAGDAAAEALGLLHLVKIDVDADRKTAALFRVSVIPELVLMTGEMKIVSRHTGAMSADELSAWVTEARKRVASGAWEGTAIDEKVQMPRATSAEAMQQLVALLATQDPAERARAAAYIESQRDLSVPALIKGMNDPYLGVRIASGEILARLAPGAPRVDPWATKAARAEAVKKVEEWWLTVASLPAPGTVEVKADVDTRPVAQEIRAVLSNDPVLRTQSMSTLVRRGPAVLPTVREAVRKAAETGDQKGLWLLEDVRWAILVPDAIERSSGVRRALARGASEERQAATTRLGKGGTPALAALRELVDDADPLVRESAVGALGSVGGSDALDAMAVLLEATDANLRMVAAQTLGHSKNAEAAKHLVKVLNDPDEVVACVAIAALEEIGAKDRAADLVKCLSDKRWRVRAAAAEVIGKMEMRTAGDDLAKLLEDDDPFVVKSALVSLQRMDRNASPEQLRKLIERLPDLTRLAVEFIVRNDDAEALKQIEIIFDKVDETTRLELIDALAERENDEEELDDHWKPLLVKMATSKDVQFRRRMMRVLARRSVRLASGFLTDLLKDEDLEVRKAAAAQVIRVAVHHWGVSEMRDKGDFGILDMLRKDRERKDGKQEDGERPEAPPPDVEEDEEETEEMNGGDVYGGRIIEMQMRIDRRPVGLFGAIRQRGQMAKSEDIEALHAEWHKRLKPLYDETKDPVVAIAWYVTGDGREGLDVLKTTFETADLKQRLADVNVEQMCRLVLTRLPWPEGREVLEAGVRSPVLYPSLLSAARFAPKDARDLLAGAGLIVQAVENAHGEALNALAELLVGGRSSSVSLFNASVETERTVAALGASKSPAARALAVLVYGRKGTHPDRVEKALTDENKWVRMVAVQSFVLGTTTQEAREEKLAPLLADRESEVALLAAVALLDPPMRDAIGLQYRARYFHYEDISVWMPSDSDDEADTRPLAAIGRKPAFLDTLRGKLRGGVENEQERMVYALLLAQYGENEGIDRMLELWKQGGDPGHPQVLLVALGLTRDPKYLEPLKKQMEKADDQWDLRNLLKWLRGIKGDEARKLRREINRRIRAFETTSRY